MKFWLFLLVWLPALANAALPLRGISLNTELNHHQSCEDLKTLKAAWHYSWGQKTPCPEYDATFIPMQKSGDKIELLAERMAGKKYDALLGFNEPDVANQADMTVAEALQLWPKLEAVGLPLGSPAVKQENAKTWLKEFMTKAKNKGYRVDFVALHVYWDCERPATMKEYLEEVKGLFPDHDFWITEFGCLKLDYQGSVDYFEAVRPHLEAEPRVKRYAWWSTRTTLRPGTSLIYPKADGGLTPMGKAYVKVPNGLDNDVAVVGGVPVDATAAAGRQVPWPAWWWLAGAVALLTAQ